jgi:hypothetical protein
MGSRFVFVVILSTVLSAVTTASGAPLKQAWWLAASGPQVEFDDRNWGRLSLDDGELSFVANGYEWRVDVADIARIETVKSRPDTVAIDTASGATYFVVILDANLTPESPRRFVQEIERGLKDTRRTTRATLVAKGSR